MIGPLVRTKKDKVQYLLTKTTSGATPGIVHCKCESFRELPGAYHNFDSTEVRWFNANELELLDGLEVPLGYENA